MSDVETDFNEQELFDEAVTDEQAQDTPAEQPTVAEVEEQPSQPRDETGRFAKPEAETVEDEATPDERIPKWRREEIAAEKNRAVDDAKAARDELARERSEKADLARRLQALEKPQTPADQADNEPDPLLDPKGYAKHVRDQVREDLLSERREDSLQAAHGKYKEEFEEAYKTAQQRIDPALKAKMQASRDPGETLIQWHREQKANQEVGGDIAAYKQRLREEALKDPEFLAKAVEAARGSAVSQQPNGRPNVQLPPSLSGASRANAALRSDDNPSDEQLFEQLTG